MGAERVGAASEVAHEAEFEPYIADSTSLREFSWRGLILGTILGVVFGASSLYLVLKVGLTVSAEPGPAARFGGSQQGRSPLRSSLLVAQAERRSPVLGERDVERLPAAVRDGLRRAGLVGSSGSSGRRCAAGYGLASGDQIPSSR